MSARFLPVEPAPTVVGVDLAETLLPRVGPVGETALGYASEDLVKLALADKERVVLRMDGVL